MLVALLLALAAPCLVPPLEAPMTDRFRMPACTYCAGNRGIEYGPAPGTVVVAVADGEVDFAGTVAGVRWLVVRHADGLRASYGHLASLRVGRGDRVRAGQPLGTTGDRFYLGLRDGDRPVDPTPLLGVLRRPPRLVPVDGTPARPARPPRLVCANAGVAR